MDQIDFRSKNDKIDDIHGLILTLYNLEESECTDEINTPNNRLSGNKSTILPHQSENKSHPPKVSFPNQETTLVKSNKPENNFQKTDEKNNKDHPKIEIINNFSMLTHLEAGSNKNIEKRLVNALDHLNQDIIQSIYPEFNSDEEFFIL